MPGTTLVRPVAAPSMGPARATATAGGRPKTTIAEATPVAARPQRPTGLLRLEGRVVVGASSGLAVGANEPTGPAQRRAIARAAPVVPDAASTAVEILATGAAEGAPLPADAPVVAVAKAGTATGEAAEVDVGRLPLQPTRAVVAEAVPTSEVVVDVAQVVGLAIGPAAGAEGRTTASPRAAVISGAALLRHAHEAPLAGLLVVAGRVPHAAKDGTVHELP